MSNIGTVQSEHHFIWWIEYLSNTGTVQSEHLPYIPFWLLDNVIELSAGCITRSASLFNNSGNTLG